ncbi:hypothetical protein HK102_007582, partial [Quaeritorhiza haematococci]
MLWRDLKFAAGAGAVAPFYGGCVPTDGIECPRYEYRTSFVDLRAPHHEYDQYQYQHYQQEEVDREMESAVVGKRDVYRKKNRLVPRGPGDEVLLSTTCTTVTDGGGGGVETGGSDPASSGASGAAPNSAPASAGSDPGSSGASNSGSSVSNPGSSAASNPASSSGGSTGGASPSAGAEVPHGSTPPSSTASGPSTAGGSTTQPGGTDNGAGTVGHGNGTTSGRNTTNPTTAPGGSPGTNQGGTQGGTPGGTPGGLPGGTPGTDGNPDGTEQLRKNDTDNPPRGLSTPVIAATAVGCILAIALLVAGFIIWRKRRQAHLEYLLTPKPKTGPGSRPSSLMAVGVGAGGVGSRRNSSVYDGSGALPPLDPEDIYEKRSSASGSVRSIRISMDDVEPVSSYQQQQQHQHQHHQQQQLNINRTGSAAAAEQISFLTIPQGTVAALPYTPIGSPPVSVTTLSDTGGRHAASASRARGAPTSIASPLSQQSDAPTYMTALPPVPVISPIIASVNTPRTVLEEDDPNLRLPSPMLGLATHMHMQATQEQHQHQGGHGHRVTVTHYEDLETSSVEAVARSTTKKQ